MWQNWAKWIWNRATALSALCNVLCYINNSWYWNSKNHMQSVHEVMAGCTVVAGPLKSSTVQPQCAQVVELHHSKWETNAAVLTDTTIHMNVFTVGAYCDKQLYVSCSAPTLTLILTQSGKPEGQWCVFHNCHTEHIYSRWLLRFLIFHTSH